MVRGNYPSGIDIGCAVVVIGQHGYSNRLDVSNHDDSDGKAGFSYTKLDINDNDLTASDSTRSCVRDNVILNLTTVIPNLTNVILNLTNVIPNLTNVIPNLTTVIPNLTTVIPNLTSVIPNLTSVILSAAKDLRL
jgi:hypothetical protein